MDEVHVARADDHRDDRHPAADERLGLIGVERRRGDEVVVEPVQALGQLVEQRTLGHRDLREGGRDPLGVVGRVGVGALREQDVHVGAGSLALGRRGERRRGHLVGREAGRRRAAEHLGHETRQRFGAHALRRPLRDMRPRPVAARDVAGVGQALVDGPDRVGVHPQRGSQLADGGEPGTGQEASRVDLVGQLPVDLGGDRDVRVALDVQAARGPLRSPAAADAARAACRADRTFGWAWSGLDIVCWSKYRFYLA